MASVAQAAAAAAQDVAQKTGGTWFALSSLHPLSSLCMIYEVLGMTLYVHVMSGRPVETRKARATHI
eukprot:1195670-Prorocentrum_minimum.AAC.3